MKNKASGVFQEDNGNKSMMRVMCFISLIASMFFGGVTLLEPANDGGQTGIFITLMFLVGAFAPKALQKMAESKLT